MKLLFVDDQRRELDGLSRMMNWSDLDIEIAGGVTEARAALEIVEREKIDIVVTDVIMQDMDGLTLVRELKTRHPEIKTICISGFDDFKFVSMAINNGASAYVLKPILVNEMRTALERVISDLKKERQFSRESLGRARLALLCMDAKDWSAGLDAAKLGQPVRVLHGAGTCAAPALASLELNDGTYIAIIAAQTAVPPDARASGVLPLVRAREGYLELTAASAPAQSGADEQDVVETIKRNIEDNLDSDPDMDKLLENVFLSSSYANMLFKEATGMTIHRYMVHRRLQSVADMLVEHPEIRVKDIALKCGFADASHLINSFQKCYNMTPERYRRLRRFNEENS